MENEEKVGIETERIISKKMNKNKKKRENILSQNYEHIEISVELHMQGVNIIIKAFHCLTSCFILIVSEALSTEDEFIHFPGDKGYI